MSQENVEVVRRFFDAINAGGVEALAKYLHPEVVWHTASEAPEAGTYRGVEAVMTYLRDVASYSHDVRFDVDEVIDLGPDEVLVATTVHLHPLGSDDEMQRHDWCFVGMVRGGKVIRIRSYLNRRTALEAAGLRE